MRDPQSESVLRRLTDLVTTRHNQLQLLAYEGANAVLFLHENSVRLKLEGVTGLLHQSPTAMSALCFASASALISLFSPTTRSSFLMYGGIMLAAGGVFLALAGFPLAGAAVVVSSLETARGGLDFPGPTQGFARFVASASGLRAYQVLVRWLTAQSPFLHRWLNGRPFLVGTVIKTPLRAGVVLCGDPVTAAVGTCWAIGDLLLGLNDRGLRRAIRCRSGLSVSRAE